MSINDHHVRNIYPQARTFMVAGELEITIRMSAIQALYSGPLFEYHIPLAWPNERLLWSSKG
jgi:hypothetical protein